VLNQFKSKGIGIRERESRAREILSLEYNCVVELLPVHNCIDSNVVLILVNIRKML